MFRFKQSCILLTFLSCLFSSTFAFSDDRNFTVTLGGDRGNSARIDLHSENKRVLESGFKIQLFNLTERDDVSDLVLYDKSAKEIKFRTKISYNGKSYIIGTSRPDLNFVVSSANEINGKLQLSFSAIDRAGKFIHSLDRDDFTVFDNNGRRLCFDLTNARQSLAAISIGIAIDISGSMESLERELNSAVNVFLKSLPIESYCSIVEFNHEFNSLHINQKCNNIRSFAISEISGGTSLFPALAQTYKHVKIKKDSAFRLVLVISDGATGSEGIKEAENEKKDTTTFINWLGTTTKNPELSKFANAEIFGSVGENGTLSEFFKSAGTSVNAQYFAKQCN